MPQRDTVFDKFSWVGVFLEDRKETLILSTVLQYGITGPPPWNSEFKKVLKSQHSVSKQGLWDLCHTWAQLFRATKMENQNMSIKSYQDLNIKLHEALNRPEGLLRHNCCNNSHDWMCRSLCCLCCCPHQVLLMCYCVEVSGTAVLTNLQPEESNTNLVLKKNHKLRPVTKILLGLLPTNRTLTQD